MSNERTGVLELTLGDSYIGSAYSPQVEVTDTAAGHEVAITYMSPSGLVTERFDVADGATGAQGPAGFSPTVTITDTPTGHTVTITDADGPHSYDVPNYAQEEQQRQDAWDALSGEVTDAISDAETATSAASTAAQSATGAASSATSAAQAANTAASSATTAASSANAAATAANSAATAAGTAADAATTAAGDATDAASAANTAAQAAQEAAKGISGAADALMGEPSESTWARRTSTGSGMARVESVQGAAEVQNDELIPVRIAGIQSVGFNQWDEQWESGQFNTATGEKVAASERIRSKNYIPVFPSTAYYFECGTTSNNFTVCYYDAAKGFVGAAYPAMNSLVTTPANAYYLMFTPPFAYGTTYNYNICINISDQALNGTYKPYMTDSVEWTAQTLRAAGSVRDELTSDELITHVGVISDASALRVNGFNAASHYITLFLPTLGVNTISKKPNVTCIGFTAIPTVGDKHCYITSAGALILLCDNTWATQADALNALSGVAIYYELGTPIVTPINPALPMSYKIEQGGMESIIVPGGEISAAPVLTVAEGESAADVVMDALACIAAPDGPTATANHAVNTYLTMQGALYKVTSAIAVGETIAAGTNVTATTVMAELIARTA